jgi:hypothetical protein
VDVEGKHVVAADDVLLGQLERFLHRGYDPAQRYAGDELRFRCNVMRAFRSWSCIGHGL